jgi:hypothetical protein
LFVTYLDELPCVTGTRRSGALDARDVADLCAQARRRPRARQRLASSAFACAILAFRRVSKGPHVAVLMWYHNTVHRLFQDDLPAVSVSKLRATGVVVPGLERVEIAFGQGDDALRRRVLVTHQKFPNGGGWSFFLCPACSRRVRMLKLYDGRVVCRRCCLRLGLGYRARRGADEADRETALAT